MGPGDESEWGSESKSPLLNFSDAAQANLAQHRSRQTNDARAFDPREAEAAI